MREDSPTAAWPPPHGGLAGKQRRSKFLMKSGDGQGGRKQGNGEDDAPCDAKKKKTDSLFGYDLGVSGRARGHNGLPGISNAGAGSRKALARWTMRTVVSRGALAVVMRHVRGQEAFVHALRAVLARRAAIFVDAFRLAFAAANTGSSRPEGG